MSAKLWLVILFKELDTKRGGGAYFNNCSNNTYGVPQNVASFQYSHSGGGYLYIQTFDSIMWQNGGARGFAIGKLSKTLVAGTKYHVGYYVSLADSFIFACNYMGMYFSDTIPTFNNIGTYPVPPLTASVEFYQDLTNKTEWIKLDTTYIANGTERFITIANFRDNSQCHNIYIGGNDTCTNVYCWYGAAYLVDDVFVEELDESGLSSINLANEDSFKLVPNPTQNSLLISTDFEISHLSFFNALGALVYTESKYLANRPVNTSNLPNGVYTLKIETKENEVVYKRLVIQK
jgi:hypothetical protein